MGLETQRYEKPFSSMLFLCVTNNFLFRIWQKLKTGLTQRLSCADEETQVCSDLNGIQNNDKCFLVCSISIGSKQALHFLVEIFPQACFLIVLLSTVEFYCCWILNSLSFQHSVFSHQHTIPLIAWSAANTELSIFKSIPMWPYPISSQSIVHTNMFKYIPSQLQFRCTGA